MNEVIISSILTGIAGAIASVWSYWTGRKKRASEGSRERAEALQEMNETIDQQCARINDLYNLVLTLKDENFKLTTQNEQLLSNQESLKMEIESLRKELAQYKVPRIKSTQSKQGK